MNAGSFEIGTERDKAEFECAIPSALWTAFYGAADGPHHPSIAAANHSGSLDSASLMQ